MLDPAIAARVAQLESVGVRRGDAIGQAVYELEARLVEPTEPEET